MYSEIGTLLRDGKVKIFDLCGGRYRLNGVDVIGDSLQLTVVPILENWFVAVVNNDASLVFVGETLSGLLESAPLSSGALVSLYSVRAKTGKEALTSWMLGKKLFEFAWLGT